MRTRASALRRCRLPHLDAVTHYSRALRSLSASLKSLLTKTGFFTYSWRRLTKMNTRSVLFNPRHTITQSLCGVNSHQQFCILSRSKMQGRPQRKQASISRVFCKSIYNYIYLLSVYVSICIISPPLLAANSQQPPHRRCAMSWTLLRSPCLCSYYWCNSISRHADSVAHYSWW